MRALVTMPRLAVLGALLAVGAAAGLLQPVPSDAAVGQVPFAAPVSDTQAVTLLQQARQAETSVFYEGDAEVGEAGSYRHAHVVHIPGRGTYVSSQSGGPALYEPDSELAADSLSLLTQHYVLALAGTGTQAGRPVWVVTAQRPDGSLAARFWLDRASAVVLGRAAYDASGAAYDEMRFTSIVVGVGAGTAGAVSGTMSPLSSASPVTTVVRPDAGVQKIAHLRRQGWRVAGDLPGGFELYDARVAGSGSAAVLHLSYTDGLCSLSVFEQRGRLVGQALAGWHEKRMAHRTVYVDSTSPQRLAWQGPHVVFAVFTDAAPSRLASVVAALPAGHVSNGVLDRLSRGFGRLGGWLDPFH